MRAIIRRAIVPALLLIGGLASLIYGAIFHAVPLLEEHETETTIEVPAEFAPPPEGEALPPGGAPFGEPLVFVKKTVKRVELITTMESEPTVTRDASVGGIEVLDSGELKRTYSGKGPALCPS
jgi:hypothetical protein